MSSVQERLQQLLDGELDPSEIADDPTLVSLADRLYGIKIAAVQPVKARDAQDLLAGTAPVTEVAPPTDMLVEVIGSVGAPAGVAPRSAARARFNLTCHRFPRRRRVHCALCSSAAFSLSSSTSSVCSRPCSTACVSPMRAVALSKPG